MSGKIFYSNMTLSKLNAKPTKRDTSPVKTY